MVALAILNLEHVVFDIMGGMTPEQRSGNDSAYYVVLMLSLVSVYAAPVLFIAYLYLIALAAGGQGISVPPVEDKVDRSRMQ